MSRSRRSRSSSSSRSSGSGSGVWEPGWGGEVGGGGMMTTLLRRHPVVVVVVLILVLVQNLSKYGPAFSNKPQKTLFYPETLNAKPQNPKAQKPKPQNRFNSFLKPFEFPLIGTLLDSIKGTVKPLQ